MDGNNKPYNYISSSRRIKEILDQPAGTFEDIEGLPDRDKLTYTNGFYGSCSAIFIDIRDSAGLTQKHKRPTLAKLYRAFISEMVAVLNSDPLVREVNIVGDCVWAVYKTNLVSHIADVYEVAAKANTLVLLLNRHFEKKGIAQIEIGLGLDYGRVLMVKAGYSGSGINDVIYMGDVVNSAAHLASQAGKGWTPPMFLSGSVYQNLDEEQQRFFNSRWVQNIGTVYTGNVIETAMKEWIETL